MRVFVCDECEKKLPNSPIPEFKLSMKVSKSLISPIAWFEADFCSSNCLVSFASNSYKQGVIKNNYSQRSTRP